MVVYNDLDTEGGVGAPPLSLPTFSSADYGLVRTLSDRERGPSVCLARHRLTDELHVIKRLKMPVSAASFADWSSVPQEAWISRYLMDVQLQEGGGETHGVVDIMDVAIDQQDVVIVTDYCHEGELLQVLTSTTATKSSAIPSPTPSPAPSPSPSTPSPTSTSSSRSSPHERALPESLCRAYLRNILSAVSSLHALGVTHRDISLENVVLHRDGNLRLIDFGQAEWRWGEEGRAERTFADKVGKPSYRAPEVTAARWAAAARGRESDCGAGAGGGADGGVHGGGGCYLSHYEGPPVDVFACGVVGFGLAVGRLPWRFAACSDRAYRYFLTRGIRSLISAIRKGDPSSPSPSPSPSPAPLSAHLTDLLQHLLNPDPQKRLTAAEALQHPFIHHTIPPTVPTLTPPPVSSPLSVAMAAAAATDSSPASRSEKQEAQRRQQPQPQQEQQQQSPSVGLSIPLPPREWIVDRVSGEIEMDTTPLLPSTTPSVRRSVGVSVPPISVSTPTPCGRSLGVPLERGSESSGRGFAQWQQRYYRGVGFLSPTSTPTVHGPTPRRSHGQQRVESQPRGAGEDASPVMTLSISLPHAPSPPPLAAAASPTASIASLQSPPAPRRLATKLKLRLSLPTSPSAHSSASSSIGSLVASDGSPSTSTPPDTPLSLSLTPTPARCHWGDVSGSEQPTPTPTASGAAAKERERGDDAAAPAVVVGREEVFLPPPPPPSTPFASLRRHHCVAASPRAHAHSHAHPHVRSRPPPACRSSPSGGGGQWTPTTTCSTPTAGLMSPPSWDHRTTATTTSSSNSSSNGHGGNGVSESSEVSNNNSNSSSSSGTGGGKGAGAGGVMLPAGIFAEGPSVPIMFTALDEMSEEESDDLV
ncbi:unnamed protein product [Vitrella brassicaformis CCMP3155]|uniref:Protein kinase domain-containing protein n=2 Tax=Vitrella brassicaformis TaxID=1169539 RepID=A0A0G4GFJ5_VITBC|nr:unnamed protein product [Vitrella brassicaformis CCMP3155]|mmetsp:Transcript_49282/g.123509  ORF Transcript_49282/g.123509 Transcript_49282/m.123509 type:complete len:872 (+) Transcript_49282:191-2806(+)|eukprot:CEM28303.1 unnamed protein product [Vitrella brassicaformis CCMP3155]